MSRIGKQLVMIPEGVKVSVSGSRVQVEGTKGKLELEIPKVVKLEQRADSLALKIDDEQNRGARALWGTYQRLLSNLVLGVSQGFLKRLEYQGIGWRVEVKGNKLILNLGFSHPIEYKIPEGIAIEVEKTSIAVSGTDKQQVGQVAAEIRAFRKPEPYKGKGIRYEGERVRRKAGKQAKTAAA